MRWFREGLPPPLTLEWKLILNYNLMNKITLKKGIPVFFLSILLTVYNCSGDDTSYEAEQTQTTMNLTYPDQVVSSASGEFKLTLKEKNSGAIYTFEKEKTKTITKKVITGTYQINVDGYIVSDNDTLQIYGLIENTSITPASSQITIPLHLKVSSKEGYFLIQEVFFTGTVYPVTGKVYNSGKYFKIYNNSNRILYADGLLIAQSQFNTTLKHNITPNIFSTDFPVQAILQLPGKGSDYPVKPGQSIVVCDNAINHKQTNSNAYDMTPSALIGKDGTQYVFEYPNTANPALGQVDNPEVPNAQVIFSTLNYNMFFLHNGGAEAYAIARLDKNTTLEQYLSQYKYDYSYVNAAGTITNRSTYKIPNSWITDAVNVSIEGKYEWLVTSTSLDRSWTYCSLIASDKTRYDKCIKRKIQGKNDKGIDILQDTNNSQEDFIPRAPLFIQ
ncbi:DUF4876 domain-containing protein [Apibacter sp. HY039]|uniref:DUF4876 domain-containing protein n=1 Tax=Apibacter sp. HY039 TaxID=2501476 RepID=UPI0013E2B833|nr:DUF4876 domain-containing protein [Apibacter sp. HY039]